MSGQAAAAPITAILTQRLQPILGFKVMFYIIAGLWNPQNQLFESLKFQRI